MPIIYPLKFSSRKKQEDSIIGGLVPPGNFLTDTLHSVISWYEMWVNPGNVTINRQYIQRKQHTAGAVVVYHFRKELPVMQVTGYCGWIKIKSIMEELRDSVMSDMTGGGKFDYSDGFSATKEAGKNVGKGFVKGFKAPFSGGLDGSSNRMNNSPRLFLERLRDLAEEPAYFIDGEGVEHYNVKYIKIFKYFLPF